MHQRTLAVIREALLLSHSLRRGCDGNPAAHLSNIIPDRFQNSWRCGAGSDSRGAIGDSRGLWQV